MIPRVAYQLIHDGADARRSLPNESRDVLHDMGRRRGQAIDARSHGQEHCRQGRVPADRRNRAALRADAGGPVARAGPGHDDGHIDDRVERGRDARRSRRQVPLARQGRHGHAELRFRTGAGVLGEVRPLLRRRDPRGPVEGQPIHARARRPRPILRREHHHGGGDVGPDVHRAVRGCRGHQPGAGHDAGPDWPGHPDPRRRGQRRIPRAVRGARAALGFPTAEGQVAQRVRAQDRSGSAGRGAGRSSAKRRTCPRS